MKNVIVLDNINKINVLTNTTNDKTILVSNISVKLVGSSKTGEYVSLRYSDGSYTQYGDIYVDNNTAYSLSDTGSKLMIKDGQNLVISSNDLSGVLDIVIEYELI